MDKIEPGIRAAVRKLADDSAAFDDVAHAILTTDTRTKVSARSFPIAGKEICVTGFAKGAAMIGPNMATMVAFVFTDATIAPNALASIARRAAAATFNCVSVEGHTSTNDTLLFFANGLAHPPRDRALPLTGEALARFDAAATDVCADLARAIAADAEGATPLVVLRRAGWHDFEGGR